MSDNKPAPAEAPAEPGADRTGGPSEHAPATEAAASAAPAPSPAEHEAVVAATTEAADGDERVPPPTGEPSGEPGPEERIAELDKRIAELAATAKSAHDRMLRVAADFENFRKRSTREVEDALRRGQQTAVKQLLPVFDNIERAMARATQDTDARSMAEGVRMVHKQFVAAIGKLGIERVATIGAPFDPMVHESIQYEHHPEIVAGLVAAELQAGYRQGELLLRPALVVVSKGPKPVATPVPAEPVDAAAPEGEVQRAGTAEDGPAATDPAPAGSPGEPSPAGTVPDPTTAGASDASAPDRTL